MADPDPFSVLGLPPDCSVEDVEEAYRRAARRYHPDKNPGFQDEAHREMKRLNAARDRLRVDLDGERQRVAVRSSQAREGIPLDRQPRSAPSPQTDSSFQSSPRKRRHGPLIRMALIASAVFLVAIIAYRVREDEDGREAMAAPTTSQEGSADESATSEACITIAARVEPAPQNFLSGVGIQVTIMGESPQTDRVHDFRTASGPSEFRYAGTADVTLRLVEPPGPTYRFVRIDGTARTTGTSVFLPGSDEASCSSVTFWFEVAG